MRALQMRAAALFLFLMSDSCLHSSGTLLGHSSSPPDVRRLALLPTRQRERRLVLRGGGKVDEGPFMPENPCGSLSLAGGGLRGGGKEEGSFTLGDPGESFTLGGGAKVKLPVPAAELARMEKRKKTKAEGAAQLIRDWGKTISPGEGADGAGMWTIGGRVSAVSVYGVCMTQKWDKGEMCWEDMPSMCRPRIGCAAAVLGERIYVTGGWHTTLTASDEVEVTHMSGTEGWEFAPAMAKNRSSHAIASLDGYLYVSGGWDEEGKIRRSVERWKPGMAAWEKCGSLKTGRHSHGMAAIGGRLVVAGGENSTKSMQDSCEVYDPEAGVWEYMPCRMSKKRMSFPLIPHGGKLYAVAGADQQGPPPLPPPSEIDPSTGQPHEPGYYARIYSTAPPLSVQIPGWVGGEAKPPGEYCAEDDRILYHDITEPYVGGSVDVFDPVKGQWELLPNGLVHPRADHGACVVDGTLFAIGGLNDDGSRFDEPNWYHNETKMWEIFDEPDPSFHASVERMDARTGKWEVVDDMVLDNGQGSFACVSVPS